METIKSSIPAGYLIQTHGFLVTFDHVDHSYYYAVTLGVRRFKSLSPFGLISIILSPPKHSSMGNNYHSNAVTKDKHHNTNE